MEKKKIIAYINAENEYAENIIKLADKYSCEGADELFIFNYTGDETAHEEFLSTMRKIDKLIDIPFSIGVYISRFEDAKKALYTGASKVVIRKALLPVKKELDEILARFDKEKLVIEIDMQHDFHDADKLSEYHDMGFGAAMLKHIELDNKTRKAIEESKTEVIVRDSLIRNMVFDILSIKNVTGIATNYYDEKSIFKAKRALKTEGVDVEVFESVMEFKDFKKLSNGLVPAIVQDYRTGEVLMLAYMNEESFNATIESGKMTYYSRSRNELWCKGDTSGHYQYVKELRIDCDSDTILAKVRQIGAACHTGNRSCFFTELAKKEFVDTNPLTVLTEDFNVIMNRKNNPKEGSYTNYLFDKGIDKILKKCGEEATEIVIAAKNPDAEELKYEIADFLYHLMVLMAECNLDWEDVMKELVNRR